MANSFIDYFLRRATATSPNRQDRANDAVRTRMLVALGAGLVPFPIVDIAAVTGVQLDMISRLCRIYGVDYSESIGKSLLSALAGSTLARIGASLVKTIPVAGPFLGGVSMAVLSGATTFALGQVFISHFENGGTLQDFDFKAYQKYYEENLELGKKVASKLKQEQGSQSQDAFARLEKLNKLKEKGIITEEEFQRKKEEVLRNL
jgi:uncharacterized protein (DUF697 family)